MCSVDPAVMLSLLLPAPERSRNKERLEASLAGLYKLELLKQKQQKLVLGALLLGDSLPAGGAAEAEGSAQEETNKWQSRSLQRHVGSRRPMEEQMTELKIHDEIESANPEKAEAGPSSQDKTHGPWQHGCHKEDDCHVPSFTTLTPQTTATMKGEDMLPFDLSSQAIVVELLDKIRQYGEDEEGDSPKVDHIFGLLEHQVLAMRPWTPRTSLANEARVVSVSKQHRSPCKDEQPLSRKGSPMEKTGPVTPQVDPDYPLGFFDEALSDHFQQTVPQEAGFCHKSRHASIVNTPQSGSLDSFYSRGSHKHYTSPIALTKGRERHCLDDQLVSAEYIPAQPCQNSARAFTHHVSSHRKDPEVSKDNQCAYALKHFHRHDSMSNGGSKKCRSNEDRGAPNRRVGKKLCRSQIPSCPQRVPDRKSSSTERDKDGGFGRGSRGSQSKARKQQQGSSGYKLPDESEQLMVPISAPRSTCMDHSGRRGRKSRPANPAASCHHHHSLHHQLQPTAVVCQSDTDREPLRQVNEDYSPPGAGESESTVSEPDVSDSSSLSSDSDESARLVWPQDLSTQPSPPPPPAACLGGDLEPKVVVKIKASHALKKKILRFRTGSLKVMTTV